jgi:hypothetical protein
MIAVKQYLDAIDPRLWWITVAVVVYATMELWKRFLPGLFQAVPARWRALPPLLLAGAFSATAAVDLPALIIETILGTVSGVMAVGGRDTINRAKSRPQALPVPPPPPPPGDPT